MQVLALRNNLSDVNYAGLRISFPSLQLVDLRHNPNLNCSLPTVSFRIRTSCASATSAPTFTPLAWTSSIPTTTILTTEFGPEVNMTLASVDSPAPSQDLDWVFPVVVCSVVILLLVVGVWAYYKRQQSYAKVKEVTFVDEQVNVAA